MTTVFIGKEKSFSQLCSIKWGVPEFWRSWDWSPTWPGTMVGHYKFIRNHKKRGGCKELCNIKGKRRRRKEATTDKKTRIIKPGLHRSSIINLLHIKKKVGGQQGMLTARRGVLRKTNTTKSLILWFFTFLGIGWALRIHSLNIKRTSYETFCGWGEIQGYETA
jgi:hypothetical protein